jgi:hypothetical protein
LSTYVSCGEPLAHDPLPDPFLFSGNTDLHRRRALRESAMVGEGAINLALGKWDENNSDPVRASAVVRLGEIAAGRGMPLTLDAEAKYGYDSALWVTNEAECKRRIDLVATVLSIWKAYFPATPRYVFNGTPPSQSSPEHNQFYPDFADYEAERLAKLVSGPSVWFYKRVWHSDDHWEGECDFYRLQGRKRYSGQGKLVVSPQQWDEIGLKKGYVGDDTMARYAAYAAKYGLHLEWWGLAHTALGPEPGAWEYLRKTIGTNKRS